MIRQAQEPARAIKLQFLAGVGIEFGPFGTRGLFRIEHLLLVELELLFDCQAERAGENFRHLVALKPNQADRVWCDQVAVVVRRGGRSKDAFRVEGQGFDRYDLFEHVRLARVCVHHLD